MFENIFDDIYVCQRIRNKTFLLSRNKDKITIKIVYDSYTYFHCYVSTFFMSKQKRIFKGICFQYFHYQEADL